MINQIFKKNYNFNPLIFNKKKINFKIKNLIDRFLSEQLPCSGELIDKYHLEIINLSTQISLSKIFITLSKKCPTPRKTFQKIINGEHQKILKRLVKIMTSNFVRFMIDSSLFLLPKIHGLCKTVERVKMANYKKKIHRNLLPKLQEELQKD